MVEWFALVLFVALVLWTLREKFVDTEYKSGGPVGVATAVQRPPSDPTTPLYAVWKSKIDAQVPIGANDDDYIKAIQAFYDKVYEPATTKPTTADVERFLAGPDVNGVPVDPAALRIILVDGFHIDIPSKTAQETKQEEIDKAIADIKTGLLEPRMGRDEVYTRSEQYYDPADDRRGGPLPEGYYAPLKQQGKPRRPGEAQYATVGRTGALFYDVCSETKKPGCEENVL